MINNVNKKRVDSSKIAVWLVLGDIKLDECMYVFIYEYQLPK